MYLILWILWKTSIYIPVKYHYSLEVKLFLEVTVPDHFLLILYSTKSSPKLFQKLNIYIYVLQYLSHH